MSKPDCFIETCLQSEVVFSGRLLHVLRDKVALPGGGISQREFIRHPGAAVVIPYLENRRLLLVRQFRYPTGEVMIELRAGKIDGGESPEETTRRELAEETGFTPGRLFHLAMIHPCVGYSNEQLHLFWVDHLLPAASAPDDDEHIEPLTVSIDEALQLLFSGRITDAKTVIGLFWAERLLNDAFFRRQCGID